MPYREEPLEIALKRLLSGSYQVYHAPGDLSRSHGPVTLCDKN